MQNGHEYCEPGKPACSGCKADAYDRAMVDGTSLLVMSERMWRDRAERAEQQAKDLGDDLAVLRLLLEVAIPGEAPLTAKLETMCEQFVSMHQALQKAACMWCGYEQPDRSIEGARAHLLVCEKHPMAELRRRAVALLSALDRPGLDTDLRWAMVDVQELLGQPVPKRDPPPAPFTSWAAYAGDLAGQIDNLAKVILEHGGPRGPFTACEEAANRVRELAAAEAAFTSGPVSEPAIAVKVQDALRNLGAEHAARMELQARHEALGDHVIGLEETLRRERARVAELEGTKACCGPSCGCAAPAAPDPRQLKLGG